jgi:outer membrane protein
MMMNNTHALVAIAVTVALLAPTAAIAGPKLAVVDLQKVLFTTKDGRKAKAQFEGLQKKKKKQLKRRDNQLKAQEKALGKEKIALGHELSKANPRKITPLLRSKAQAFEAKVRVFQQEILDFQKTQRKVLQQLAKKEVQLLKPIEDKIKRFIAKIAKERGYTMVLNRVAVVFHVPAVDITGEVTKRMGK